VEQITAYDVKVKRRIALVLGVGLALFPIHWASQPFIDYIFLPQIGLLLITMSVVAYFLLLPQKSWGISFGSKMVWIPLLVVVASMVLQVVVRPTSQSISVGLFGVALFLLYLMGRSLPKERLILPIVVMVGLVAIGGIVVGILDPGSQDGGFITNYCAATGFLVLGGLLINRKWLWGVMSLPLISIFLIGALEGIFILAVMGIVILIRHDYSKKILLPISILIIAIVAWVAIGKADETFAHTLKNFKAIQSIEQGITDESLDQTLTGRWVVIKRAMQDIQILGHGYVLTPAPNSGDRRPVHNMPLLAVDQVGVLAGVAWLWVTIYCFVKTRWKYFWMAVMAASVFDYYIWTQFMPYWWVFAGVSLIDTNHNDLIFRRSDG